MAIPGLTPSFDVRAKVRTGEKKSIVKNGKTIEFPSSTDYFICDDPEFQSKVGLKQKELTVILPFEKPEDNFSTGLEQWAGAMLVCYTKGDTFVNPGPGHGPVQPVAFRKATMKKGGRDVNLLEGFTVTGGAMGNDRRPVICHARECPMMKVKDGCKPMGRLQFFIKGIDPRLGVYQLDTKSWNTIEKIEAFLSVLGDPRGQELTLRVEMWSRGTSKFPVVTLEGGNVKIESEADVALADRGVMLHKALADEDEAQTKNELAAFLDLSNPGWRENPEFVARIKEVGVVAAAKGVLAKAGL